LRHRVKIRASSPRLPPKMKSWRGGILYETNCELVSRISFL
jgi:hypothetical protein